MGKRLRHVLMIIIVMTMIVLCFTATASALTVDASAAILIDASTGRIIHSQNEHTELAPASTTKVLTALLVLETVDDLSDTVKLPDDFANVGESSIYLEPGEVHTYEDLLYALMLRSANDAAQALAIGVSGSEAMFAELMNSRTIQLGLNDSHWDNPHGLDTDTHLTSAYDLAMITKEALTIDKFREIIATESFTIDWEGYEYDRVIYNHNQFLDIYEGAIGVKTGYTNKSGSCLIGAAERNGLILIGVVLNAEDHYDAMTQLMDYGFANYESVEMGKKGDVVGSIKVLRSNLDTVDVVLGRDVVLPVEMGSNFEPEVKYNFPLTLDAPFNTEEPIGTAVYVDSMGYSAEIPLYASKNAELYTFKLVFSQIWQRFISWLM